MDNSTVENLTHRRNHFSIEKKSIESFKTQSISVKNKSHVFSVKRVFFLIVLCCILFNLCLLYFINWNPSLLPPFFRRHFDFILHRLQFEQRKYAVIIDCGSTGSRVLAFVFHRNRFTGDLELDEEIWHQVEPGISSYAQRPIEAARSIESLLQIAQNAIPQKAWAVTPLSLKATAGLRLLPAAQSHAIIEETESVLRNSGFMLPFSKPMEIMNPMEEGLFAWFTVNYLLLEEEDKKELQGLSYASLDLGGGSTQVTFPPTRYVEDLEKRKHFMHSVTIFGRNTSVYSHSYLGLGLMAAREAIFVASAGSPSNVTDIVSPCITSPTPLHWEFHGISYSIRRSSDASYEKCANEIVAPFVRSHNVHMAPELSERKIVAFSYFFDLLHQAGKVIGTAGVVTVEDYITQAKSACETSDDSFQCVDLVFAALLLTEGYGLHSSKYIYLYKKINGFETSWALGLAYNILEN